MNDLVGTCPRYLSPEAKERLLADWAKTKATPLPEGELGGRGWPDPNIFPLCDALNALPGVCTLQSCAGHLIVLADGSENRQPGHLWLWLSAAVSAEFDRCAFDLATSPTIDWIRRCYGGWGQEITEIIFAGDDRGQLAESSAVILAFFRETLESTR